MVNKSITRRKQRKQKKTIKKRRTNNKPLIQRGGYTQNLFQCKQELLDSGVVTDDWSEVDILAMCGFKSPQPITPIGARMERNENKQMAELLYPNQYLNNK